MVDPAVLGLQLYSILLVFFILNYSLIILFEKKKDLCFFPPFYLPLTDIPIIKRMSKTIHSGLFLFFSTQLWSSWQCRVSMECEQRGNMWANREIKRKKLFFPLLWSMQLGLLEFLAQLWTSGLIHFLYISWSSKIWIIWFNKIKPINIWTEC